MDAVTTAFGGETDAQKQLRKQQKKAAAESMAIKVQGIQNDVGTRTRELVARYGIAGAAGQGL